MFGNKRDKYYKILGVPLNATQEQIKKAYMEKVKIWHPDRNKSPEAPKKFKEIKEAYEILSGKEKDNSGPQYQEWANGQTGEYVDIEKIFEEFMRGSGHGFWGRQEKELQFNLSITTYNFIDMNRRSFYSNLLSMYDNSKYNVNVDKYLQNNDALTILYKGLRTNTIVYFDKDRNSKVIINKDLLKSAKEKSLNVEYQVYGKSKREYRAINLYEQKYLKTLIKNYSNIFIEGGGNYDSYANMYGDAIIKLEISDSQHVPIKLSQLDLMIELEIDYKSLLVGESFEFFDGYEFFKLNIPSNNGLQKIKIDNAGNAYKNNRGSLYILPVVYLMCESTSNIEILKSLKR